MMYGSFVNQIVSQTKGLKPEVGMGVTQLLWTDRNPFEIIEVKDDRHITVRELDYKRVDNRGMSDCQDYEYFSNENNRTYRLYKNNKNKWVVRVGKNGVDNSYGWYIGSAERYYDFSF